MYNEKILYKFTLYLETGELAKAQRLVELGVNVLSLEHHIFRVSPRHTDLTLSFLRKTLPYIYKVVCHEPLFFGDFDFDTVNLILFRKEDTVC